jgi:hypothetical protein
VDNQLVCTPGIFSQYSLSFFNFERQTHLFKNKQSEKKERLKNRQVSLSQKCRRKVKIICSKRDKFNMEFNAEFNLSFINLRDCYRIV